MITFYANMIRRNKLTLDRVPAKWRNAVAAELGVAQEETPEEIL